MCEPNVGHSILSNGPQPVKAGKLKCQTLSSVDGLG